MKLLINYDFFEEILNAKEPVGPLKIIRNNKRRWAKFNLPLYTAFNFAFGNNITQNLCLLAIQFGLLTTIESISSLITKKICGEDFYTAKAIVNLKKLLIQLNDLNIKTDYDLLLDSKPYKREYKIKLNEKKLPIVLESKYIMVPTYNFNGDVKDTSILQEHVVGSKKYVLSLGSPKKQFKLAYSGA